MADEKANYNKHCLLTLNPGVRLSEGWNFPLTFQVARCFSDLAAVSCCRYL